MEVGVVLSILLCMQGAIWAKPTWGVWWDWDPRLTTTAVLVFAFAGILALRRFVDDPVKRAVWSAVATIVAYVDVPIVYFSVKWWNSLHQLQSTPETVSKAFHWPLRINAFGILFLMSGMIALRTRLAALRLRRRAGAAAAGEPAGRRPAPGGQRDDADGSGRDPGRLGVRGGGLLGLGASSSWPTRSRSTCATGPSGPAPSARRARGGGP